MVELTLRLIVSLAIVVGLLLVLRGWRSPRSSAAHGRPGPGGAPPAAEPTSAVAVVTVGSRVLVLGTTEHQVNLLAELDPEELDDCRG